MKRILTLNILFVTFSALATPRFIGAETYGVRPGHELIWRIPIQGATAVEAVALPQGLTFDASRRTVRGTLAQTGDYPITLRATDGTQWITQTFTVKVGEKLCLAPPMGWNSWYSYSEAVHQEGIEKVARLLEETGLADAGWVTVVIDDCWQGERPHGKALQPNTKFTDMQAMCRAIHTRGLKAGIYSTPWISTYAGFRGSSSEDEEHGALPLEARLQPGQLYGRYPGLHRTGNDHIGKHWHFGIDAKQWADWGFDYIKVDWKPNDTPTTQRIAHDLRASGRDIVLSLSNAAPLHEASTLSKLAQLWRTTGDIQDTWESIRTIGRAQLRWLPYRTEGHWNDPDILQIGQIGTPNQKNTTFRPSRLTDVEQHYQMALWCMLSAPLFISCDLEHLTPSTKALLTDPDLLELNQKYASAPLDLQEETAHYFVLRKTIGPGKACVYGLFNDSDQAQQITLPDNRVETVPPHCAKLLKAEP